MNILLRDISKTDIPLINKWRNDPELIKYLGSTFRYINIETDSEWFDNYQNNRRTQVRCAICLSNKSIIGLIYLLNIDYLNKSAELALFIGDKKSQGKGLGFKAIKKMLEHAFSDLNLQRVYLFVLEGNIRAINLYKKCGFVQEGLLRASIYKEGSYQNQILMSILKK